MNTIENNTPNSTETVNSNIEHITCPCCKQQTLIKPVEVNGEILDQFLACMISGQPFAHTYQMFQGKVGITVAHLTREFATRMRIISTKVDGLCTDLSYETRVKVTQIMDQMKLLCNIQSVQITGGQHSAEYQPAAVVSSCLDYLDEVLTNTLDAEPDTQTDQLLDVFEKISKRINNPTEVSAVPQIALVNVVEAHAQVSSILIASGFDTNFWAGIELA